MGRKNFCIWISQETYDALVAEAEKLGTTASELARRAIEEFLAGRRSTANLPGDAWPRCPICGGALVQDGRLLRCTTCGTRYIPHEKSDHVTPFVDKGELYKLAAERCNENIYRVAWEYASRTGSPTPGTFDAVLTALWELHREGKIEITCFGVECYILCISR